MSGFPNYTRRMSKSLRLKIKRASLFCFGLVFFLFPGQNWYLSANLKYQPPRVQLLKMPLPVPADYPLNFTNVPPPNLTAQAVAVVDRDSAVLLYGKNEKTQLLPASTVKIMTALVVLDHYQLNDVLTVNDLKIEGQKMKLAKGEKITVKNLLYGLLVDSANDAAEVLAQSYPGGQTAFVAAMNQKAKELNLNNSHFANPTGLDSDVANLSHTTALDLARLAVMALKNETFKQIVATPEITVNDVGGKTAHKLYNLNQLLGKVEGVKGVKTGWTEDAQECLVGYIERNGRGIITVVLGSQDRFGETTKITNWAFDNHRWENFTPSI